MAFSVLLEAEPVRELGWASIAGGGTYTAIGGAAAYPARMLLVQNFTDVNVMFSFNGVDDHFPLYQYSQFILDIASNKVVGNGFFLSRGQTLYVTQIGAPSLGSVYLSLFYGREII